MIRAVLIEDDPLVGNFIAEALEEIEPSITLAAKLRTVKDSVNYFSTLPAVDLIFCDVQLEDGLSFDIFESVQIHAPIVFVTGYDTFIMQALEKSGIEYLLKPVSHDDLRRALNKYKSLEKHFTSGKTQMALSEMNNLIKRKDKTRIIVRKGVEFIPLLLSNIAFFYTEKKVVFAVDRQGRKFIVDRHLNELEEEIDDQRFFRANRQYLVNVEFIKSFKPYERVKLWVELSVSNVDYTIVVSQFTASSFKKWMEKA